MNDIQIIRLYQIRDEKAIEESDKKYGSYCFAVANNILSSREDSEECVSDTWLRAWEVWKRKPLLLCLALALPAQAWRCCRSVEKSRRKLVPANAQNVPGMENTGPVGNTVTHPGASH